VKEYPGLYEFAKTAEMGAEGFKQLSDTAFAWPGARRFPVHTPEHTALSMAYLKVAEAQVPSDVMANMVKAASVHQIDPQIFAVEKTAAAPSPEGDYLVPDKQRYLVRSASDVELAESIFFEKFAQFSVEDRTQMAQGLVRTAKQHEVSLHPSTYKLACLTMTSTQIFKDWMGARKEAATRLNSPAVAEAFDKLGQAFSNTEPYLTDHAAQVKLASTVHQLDKQAGLVGQYDQTLLDPLQTVFNTDHRASDFVKVGNVLQDKTLLASLPLTFWEDALGPDIVAEIAPNGQLDPEALAQILPTLPQDLKNTLTTQLAAYNQ
jgi:hypothetical protein